MGQVLVFTSGKGGVGKTTLAANLALCLATHHQKVALVDLDIGLRNLDIVMGVEHKIVYHIGDVINGLCRLKQAMIKDYRNPNLFFLPGILSWESTFSAEGFYALVCQLKHEYDYVIIDSPAGLEKGFQFSLPFADEVFLVVNPEICSIRDASQVKNYIEKTYQLPIRLIINRTRRNIFTSRNFLSTKDIEEILSLSTYGEFPNDEHLVLYLNKGELFVEKKSALTRAMERVGTKVISENGSIGYVK